MKHLTLSGLALWLQVGVASGCLVVLALGLGLGLGLRKAPPPPVDEAESWLCSPQRCGETRGSDGGGSCSCSSDCLEVKDCCTNYRHTCHSEEEEGCWGGRSLI